MTQFIDAGMSKKDRASASAFAQNVQALSQTHAATQQDVIEAASGVGPTPADKSDFVANPLAGNPPNPVGALAPGSHKRAYTLFDAIAALGPMMMANSLVSNNDANLMSAETGRITQLGLQLRGFQKVQAAVQKRLNAEAHANWIMGIIEKVIFDVMAVTFAALIAGPVGALAAATSIGVNATLEQTHAYDKMTKHMSPTEAFFSKLGISVAIGVLTGFGTSAGISTLDSLAANEAETNAQTLLRLAGRQTATTALEDTGAVEMDTVPTQLTKMADAGAVDAEQTGQVAIKQTGEDVVADAKGGQAAGNVATRDIQRIKRSIWMGLNAGQQVVTGASSKAKGEKSATGLFGDLAYMFGGKDKAAEWTQLVMGYAMMAVEFYLGSKLMGGEVTSSSESGVQRLTRLAQSGANTIQGVAQTGAAVYGTVTGFEMSDQYRNLGKLQFVIGQIHKETGSAQTLQGIFKGALRQSTTLNKQMMANVLDTIANIKTAFEASSNSKAA